MFCSFSGQFSSGQTLVENAFFTDFLPVMTEQSIRVYLYGLYLCSNPLGEENNLENMSERLSLSVDEIKTTFKYLKNIGLVNIASTTPFIVHFNSPRKAVGPNRLYNKDKYSDFLVDLHMLFGDKELSETDIISYLDFLEVTKMEPSALLVIVKYCIDAKGSGINRAYVLKVADNWFNEGVTNLSNAENRVIEAEASSAQIREVLKALKSTRQTDITDRQYYLKWTSKMGFSFDAIIAAAKIVKRGGMDKLDANLESYFAQGIMTAEDVKKYDKRRKEMLDCAIKTVKTLGLHYEDCSFLIDAYIADWFNKGYTTDSLLMIARYSALNDVKNFSGFAENVNRFYQEGYVGIDAITLQLDALTRMDDNIKRILYAAGSSKQITASDRDLYRTWTERWRLSDEQILSVAYEAQGKAYAMSWISSRLADNLGGTPWIAPVVAPKPKKEGLGDFAKAEIKEKLKQDKDYFTLFTEIKKLEFEMSAYIVKGQEAPLPMREELDKLKLKLNERIEFLGYDPKILE